MSFFKLGRHIFPLLNRYVVYINAINPSVVELSAQYTLQRLRISVAGHHFTCSWLTTLSVIWFSQRDTMCRLKSSSDTKGLTEDSKEAHMRNYGDIKNN